MLKALRNRSIALLWAGQAASAIGDEIYRVALIWLAVALIGKDTGYIVAGQYAALLTLSLIGGKWADRWNHLHTMVRVDLLRAVVVILPVIIFHFTPVSLAVLWPVALTVAALGAFFDPALQSALPHFSPDLKTLQSATGLMSTTLRLARVVGPGIIGALTAILPTVQFFTLDSLSFLISALSIHALKSHPSCLGPLKRRVEPISFKETILGGFQAVQKKESMPYAIFAKCICGGAWSLAYMLGFALFVHQIFPTDVRAYGLMIAAYGIGNLAGALFIGNMPRLRPNLILYVGYVWMGLGFVLVALSPGLLIGTFMAAIAGFGGPMNDLPFVDLVQMRFSLDEIPKVFRLRMTVETGASLICMALAPTLFRLFSVSTVIAASGSAIALVGAVGIFRHGEKAPISENYRPVA